MEKQSKGIALILFGILLCCSDNTINYGLLYSFVDFPFAICGIILGIVGLVLVFKKDENK